MSQPIHTHLVFLFVPTVMGFLKPATSHISAKSHLTVVAYVFLSACLISPLLHAERAAEVGNPGTLDIMSTAFWQSSTPLLAVAFVCGVLLLFVLGLLMSDVMRSRSQLRNMAAQLKRSEEEQALLLWGGHLGRWQWNLNSNQIKVDEGAARLLGLPEQAGIVDMQSPGPWQQLFASIQDDFDGNEVATEKHVRTATAHRWLKLRGRLLKAKGVDPMVLGTAADVSDLHEYQERLIKKSICDPLTQVLNRHYFIERLSHSCSQAARDDNLITVALIGIDKFKTINEGYSNRIGDEVLRRFSILLQELCRPYDLVARYGDSQFITLFYGLDKIQSSIVIKRLQDSLRITQIVADNQRLYCTFSCGIADSREFEQSDLSVNSILSCCHKRLSYGKEKGNNQIVVDTQAA